MCPIQSKSGSISDGDFSIEDRAIGEAYTTSVDKDFLNKLFKQADSVPLLKVIKVYKPGIPDNSKKLCCPLPNHKGGKETTASFVIYPETNTFWCFGCKAGTKCSDFVAEYENISKVAAAKKILEYCNSLVTYYDSDDTSDSDYFNNLHDLSELSNFFRECYKKHKDKIDVIETACKTFDSIYVRHKQTFETEPNTLKSLITKIKNKLSLNLNG